MDPLASKGRPAFTFQMWSRVPAAAAAAAAAGAAGTSKAPAAPASAAVATAAAGGSDRDPGAAAAAAANTVLSNLRAASAGSDASAVAEALAATSASANRSTEAAFGKLLLRKGALVNFATVMAKHKNDSAVAAAAVARLRSLAQHHEISFELRRGGDESAVSLTLYALEKHGASATICKSALMLLGEAMPDTDLMYHPFDATAASDFLKKAAAAAAKALSDHEADAGVVTASLALLDHVKDCWSYVNERRDIEGYDSADIEEHADAGAQLARFANRTGLVPTIGSAVKRHAAVSTVMMHGCSLLRCIYDAASDPFATEDEPEAAAGDLREACAAAVTHLVAAFNERFGDAVDGAAAAVADRSSDGPNSNWQAATKTVEAVAAILTYECNDWEGAGGSAAAAIAFAASPALPLMLDMIAHDRPNGRLVEAAVAILVHLSHTEAAQPDLSRVGAAAAVGKLLARYKAETDSVRLGSMVVASSCAALNHLSESYVHEEDLLQPGTVAAVASILPAQPTPGRYTGGAFADELRTVGYAASALYRAATRHCTDRHLADMKRDAPGLGAKLAAWLPVLTTGLGATAFGVRHAKALKDLLTAAPPAATGGAAVAANPGSHSLPALAASVAAAIAASAAGAGEEGSA